MTKENEIKIMIRAAIDRFKNYRDANIYLEKIEGNQYHFKEKIYKKNSVVIEGKLFHYKEPVDNNGKIILELHERVIRVNKQGRFHCEKGAEFEKMQPDTLVSVPVELKLNEKIYVVPNIFSLFVEQLDFYYDGRKKLAERINQMPKGTVITDLTELVKGIEMKIESNIFNDGLLEMKKESKTLMNFLSVINITYPYFLLEEGKFIIDTDFQHYRIKHVPIENKYVKKYINALETDKQQGIYKRIEEFSFASEFVDEKEKQKLIVEFYYYLLDCLNKELKLILNKPGAKEKIIKREINKIDRSSKLNIFEEKEKQEMTEKIFEEYITKEGISN